MTPVFNGWTPYQQFMANLSKLGGMHRAIAQRDGVDFKVLGNMPFSNTPMHASSSFVRNIRYRPHISGHSGTAFVTLGTKNYYYPMSLRRLSNWLNSRSLGQYYNRYIKL